MRLRCLHCDHKFDGTISYDKLGWHSLCPECGGSFDVDVPKGKILMLFAGREVDFGYGFEDNHLKNAIYSYRAFNSVKAFMDRWRKLAEEPDSMWYWVIDATNGQYITTGACSCDLDRELFKDYFGSLSLGCKEMALKWALEAVDRALGVYSSDNIDVVTNEETEALDIIYHSDNNSFAVAAGIAEIKYVDKVALVKELDRRNVGHCW